MNTATSRLPGALPSLAVPLLAGIAIIWFSWPTLLTLHQRWTDFGYSHGYLVLGLSGVLAYKALRREPLAPVTPSMVGLLLLPIPILITLAGQAATTIQLAQIALPMVWLFALWAIAGTWYARRLLFAFGFIYFAIPAWDVLIGSLQSLTVFVVTIWLRTFSVPAFIDGNMIYLPVGTFEVVGGCAGLSYLIVGLSLASFIGLSRHERWSSRIALVSLALIASLFGNWVRVFSVVIAGYLTDMQHFLVTRDHYYFGWALFLILCLIPLLLLDRWLPLDPEPEIAPRRQWLRTLVQPLRAGGILLIIGVVGMTALAASVQRNVLSPAGGAPVALAEPTVPGWEVVGSWGDRSTPVFRGADSTISLRYARDGGIVNLYQASYAHQEQGREVVFYANRPVEPNARVDASSPVSVPAAGGQAAALAELEVVAGPTEPRLVWYGRRIAGHWVGSDLDAKLWQVLGAVAGRHDAYVVVLSAQCRDGCESARVMLENFAGSATAQLFGYGEVSDEGHEAVH